MSEVLACQVEILDGSTVSIDVNVSGTSPFEIERAFDILCVRSERRVYSFVRERTVYEYLCA